MYNLYVVIDDDLLQLFLVGSNLETLFNFDIALSDLMGSGVHRLLFSVVDLANGRISDGVEIVVNAIRFRPTMSPIPSETARRPVIETRSRAMSETPPGKSHYSVAFFGPDPISAGDSAGKGAATTATVGGTIGGLLLVAIILAGVLRKQGPTEPVHEWDSDEQIVMVDTTSAFDGDDHYVSQECFTSQGHHDASSGGPSDKVPDEV
jgi:hypothetical protein